LVKCKNCSAKDFKNADGNRKITSLQNSAIFRYIDKTIFKDTQAGLRLTDAGRALILDLNKSQSLKSTDLKVITQLTANIDFDITKVVTETSSLIFPCACDNIDCINSTNAKLNKSAGEQYKYNARLRNIHSHVYHSCPSCLDLSGAGSSSCEKLLGAAIKLLFDVEFIEQQPKVEPFQKVDLLFRYPAYGGAIFGIEYDGASYHKDPRTIQTDILKTEKFKELGIQFIRVREQDCTTFDSSSAHCIELTTSKGLSNGGITALEYCLTEIGKYLIGDDSYTIPLDKLKGLGQIYKDKSSWAHLRRKNYRPNKGTKVS
jgi:hypothetical protein